jgi:hypothetical protein
MRLLPLLLSFCLTACCIQMPVPRPDPIVDDDGGVTGPPEWPEGTITFGTTDQEGEVFQEIDSQLALYRGPQGGNHSYAKFQVSAGRVLQGAVFEHRVRRARDGVLVSKGNSRFDITPTDGGVWTSEGSVIMFLCPTAPGINIANERLSFEVIVKGERDGKFYGRAGVSSTLSCTSCQEDCGG